MVIVMVAVFTVMPPFKFNRFRSVHEWNVVSFFKLMSQQRFDPESRRSNALSARNLQVQMIVMVNRVVVPITPAVMPPPPLRLHLQHLPPLPLPPPAACQCQ